MVSTAFTGVVAVLQNMTAAKGKGENRGLMQLRQLRLDVISQIMNQWTWRFASRSCCYISILLVRRIVEGWRFSRLANYRTSAWQ